MKALTPELEAHLYGQEDHPPAVECWTLYFASGTQRWCSGDLDITWGGETWTASARAISKVRIHQEPGATQVDTVDLEVAPVEGETHESVIASWNGIRVVLKRAWLDASNAVVGVMTVFEGIAEEPRPSSDVIAVTVTSRMAAMKTEIPRRRLQAQCPFRLGDAACGVNLALHTTATTAAAGSTATALVIPAPTATANVGGRFTFTDGALTGVTRRIRAVSGTTITPDLPLPSVPAVGDGVSIVRGCPKTRAACRDDFDNVTRYGGQPDAPAPDAKEMKRNEPIQRVSGPPLNPYTGGMDWLRKDKGVPKWRADYGRAFPLVFGRAKVKAIPIWTGAASSEHTVYTGVASSKKGKGRVIDAVLAICLAPITSIEYVYRGQENSITEVDGLERLTAPPKPGYYHYPQGETYGPGAVYVPAEPAGAYEVVLDEAPAPWAHLVGTAAEGQAFTGLAQYRTTMLCLDDKGQIPEVHFVVDGIGGLNAHPADVITYLLTDPVNGLGLDPSLVVTDVGPDGNAASSFRRYVDQYPAWVVNRAIDSREEIGRLVEDLATACNSVVISSEGKIKFYPLGDVAFGTVNGGYTPAVTAVTLDENEVGVEGVEVTEYRGESEVFNSIPVEYPDSLVDGETQVAEYQDDSYGTSIRRGPSFSSPWISKASHAYALSQILVRRSINQRKTMKVTLGPRWAAIEPYGLVSLSDGAAFQNVLARITTLEEDEEGLIEAEAIECPESTAHPIDLTPQEYEGNLAAFEIFAPALTTPADVEAAQRAAVRGWAIADRVQQQRVAESWDWFDPNDWEVVAGDLSTLSVVESGGVAGGKVLRNTGGAVWLVHRTLIPYDSSRIYQARMRARITSGAGTVYAGFAGVAADGVTLVNSAGAASAAQQHYIAATPPDANWLEVSGYWKGTAAAGTGNGALAAPAKLHEDAKYVRRLLYLDTATTHVAEVDTLEMLIGDPVAEVARDVATSKANGNLLPNGDFSLWDDATGRPTGWSGSGYAGCVNGGSAPNLPGGAYSLLGNTDRYNSQYLNTPYFAQLAPLGDPALYYYEWLSPRIPVEVGKRYAASAYNGAHRCRASVFIYWCDATTEISASQDATSFNEHPGPGEKIAGTTLEEFKRCYSIGTAPPGAVAARIAVRKYDTKAGEESSYAFWLRAQFEQVHADAVAPGPWVAPSSNGTVGKAKDDSTQALADALAANDAALAAMDEALARAAADLSNVGAGSVTETLIATDAVTSPKIAANAVIADKIAANAVTAAKIDAGAVTAGKINVADLSAISANLGTVTAGTLDVTGSLYIGSRLVSATRAVAASGLAGRVAAIGYYHTGAVSIARATGAGTPGWWVDLTVDGHGELLLVPRLTLHRFAVLGPPSVSGSQSTFKIGVITAAGAWVDPGTVEFEFTFGLVSAWS